jgi:23S rRNA (uridine2552-2'-O)-methyltransferase
MWLNSRRHKLIELQGSFSYGVNATFYLMSPRSRSNKQYCPRYFHVNCTVRNASSPSSRAWLDRQHKDQYVQKAHDLGLPSRAYFKLEEINEKLFYPAISKKDKKVSYRRLIQPGMKILDLGAAPGGWSVYASSQLNHSLGGAVVSVDLLPLSFDVTDRIHHGLDGKFEFIEGDFTQNNTRLEIINAFTRFSSGKDADECTKATSQHCKANLIISDMAANFTGDQSTDAIRTINLCEQSLAFAAGDSCFESSYLPRKDEGMLMKNGSFLCKYFLCGKENEQDLMNAAKRVFKSIHLLKPNASRKESSEMYLLGLSKK